MCGIFGYYAVEGVSPETLARMGGVLTHRGPDDLGIHVDRTIGLGNRRLSIIDIEGGHQPLCNEDGTIWIVFNGEIYNYRALRESLRKCGHRFRTSTDTEVIVHLYEEDGAGCVHALEGMFAFAIWDANHKRLLLARDRLGQKPLYYYHRPGVFAFASEIKAILETRAIDPEPDPASLHHYLSLRFVPSPETMFRGIRKLPPAHILTHDGDEPHLRRYWELSYGPKLKLSDRDAVAALDELLGDVIEKHLVADVPVGALLSGGLDSSLVTALMSTRAAARISTFSVGVEEQDWNELPYARAVARRYNTDHHDAIARPDVLEILPKLIWHLDEPSDPSAACKYYVARAAAAHVKVVLGGDGGDEMLAGYDRYVGNRLITYYCRLPEALRRHITRRLLPWVPDSFTYKSLAQKLRWLDQMASATAAERYATSVNFFRFDGHLKDRLYTAPFGARVREIDSNDYIASIFQNAPVENLVDGMLYADVMTQLPDYGLMILDRTTMAFGLEGRSPFLDHRLAEFCARLPPHLKIRRHRSRYLQRRLAQKYLPAAVARRRKQGFGLPLGYWFRGTLGAATASLFSASALATDGYFDRDGLLSLLEEHRYRGIDHSHRLWMLLNLETWYRIFIRKQEIASADQAREAPLRA
jgi:asparagine synthase (glutamine-hydrolysing)